MVRIFTLKVRHRGNTVHPLWVSLSTKHQCCKHRVQLTSSRAPSAWNTVRTFMHVKRDGRTGSGLSDTSQPRREGSIFQELKQKCVYIFFTELPNYILKLTFPESIDMSTSGFQIVCQKWFDYVVKKLWQVNLTSFRIVFVWLLCQNSIRCSSSSYFSCKTNCDTKRVISLPRSVECRRKEWEMEYGLFSLFSSQV